jgi:aspartate-semialdehyde dehydrogenase
MDAINLAIIGATGAVGEALVECLEQRQFPFETIHLLASERTAGTSLMANKNPVMVGELNKFDFSLVNLAIFVATDEVSAEYIPLALSKGCTVIDNSRAFVDSAPLIVPGVNSALLAAQPELVVNPDSNAVQLARLLKPFDDEVGLEKVNVVALQSVSGQGKKAINELASQTASLLNGRGAETRVFPQQVAFNILPYVGDIDDDGNTAAENYLVAQTARLLGTEGIPIVATCLQVPVFYSDSMVVSFEATNAISQGAVESILGSIGNLEVVSNTDQENAPTPITHSTGSDSLFVGRVRVNLGLEKSLSCWITADNVKNSAALNTVQIAEELIKNR